MPAYHFNIGLSNPFEEGKKVFLIDVNFFEFFTNQKQQKVDLITFGIGFSWRS